MKPTSSSKRPSQKRVSKDKSAVLEEKPLAYQAVAEFLHPHIDYWRKMLRIEDWSITVAIVDYKPEEDFWARIDVKPWFHAAYLEVVNPFTDPKRMNKMADGVCLSTDLEVSLVHELLHLRYDYNALGIDPTNKPVWYSYETATEITARALVCVRHELERIMAS